MFDLTTDHRPTHDAHASPPAAIGARDVRSQALRLVVTSAGRMILAARRIDGDDGAAVAYALRDMILDRETDPIGWPLLQDAPTGLRLLADAAEDRRLHERAARHMLPVVIADCERAIARGTATRLDWYEACYVDGIAEMDCREITVPSPNAMRLAGIRAELVELHELLERVLDVCAAQDAVPGLQA